MLKPIPFVSHRTPYYVVQKYMPAFLLAVLFSLPSVGFAQTVDVGLPYTWTNAVVSDVPLVQMSPFDLAALQAEDLLNDQYKDRPYRFGYEHQVDIDMLKSAYVHTVPGKGKVYRLEIFSAGASTMSLLFSQFSLPKGATLHLYDKQAKYLIGAYTALNNNPYGELGTELIPGDAINVEYFEPQAVAGQGKLRIGMVVHGYRSPSGILKEGTTKALNDSGDCNHDVGCPTGNGWEEQISSVGLLFTGGGTCSGALVNNTSNDGTPYFLTARHCGSNYGAWVVRFNWESSTPVCASTENSVNPGPPYDETINGATLRATNGGSDFTLVELTTLTPTLVAQWDLYFAGWDRSDNIPTTTTGIHHPRGDVKKICRDNDAPTQSCLLYTSPSPRD